MTQRTQQSGRKAAGNTRRTASKNNQRVLLVAVSLGLGVAGVGGWLSRGDLPDQGGADSDVGMAAATPGSPQPGVPGDATEEHALREATAPQADERVGAEGDHARGPIHSQASAQASPSPEVLEQIELEREQARQAAADRRRTRDERRDAKRATVDRMREDQEPSVRLGAAREVLDRGAWEEGDGLLISLSLGVVAELDPAAAPAELLELVQNAPGISGASDALAMAVEDLGRTGETLGEGDLKACFEDGSLDVQVAAAEVLAKRGNPSLEQEFLGRYEGRLEDADANVRVQAVDALVAIRSERLADQVQPLLEDDAAEVRFAAVQAIGRTRDAEAIDSLRALIDDEDDQVSRCAKRAVDRHDSLTALLAE